MATGIPALFNAAQFEGALFGGGTAPGPIVQVGAGLLYPALRKAGITLGPGRTPSPAQFQDAIDELNRLTGSLNCDRLFIYAEDVQTFPITSTKIQYTIGQDPTGAILADFDAPRPQLITGANYIAQNTPNLIRYPITLLTPQVWRAIGSQALPNTIPYGLYNDRAYPLSTLYLYGQPPAGNGLELWMWRQAPQFTALTDAVAMPKQYEDALVLNLACRLAPMFQRVVDVDIRDQARVSLMRLESINAPQPVADTSALCSGYGNNRYNIYSDQFRR